MSAFAYVYELDPDEALRLRAEDAAERRRLRPHFCRDCMGYVGHGSPCAPEEDEDESEESDE